VIALVRLYAYSNDARYQQAAEETLECFAGVVDHFGLYAGNYGIALRLFSTPHTQVVVHGNDALADELYRTAISPFSLTKSVVRLRDGQAVSANLPTALAATIPELPAVREGRSVAIICSDFTCQPPISTPEQLRAALSTKHTTSISS
jgi:uncharacterized protein YyaL (SSP411 family)